MSESTNELLKLFLKVVRNPKFMMAFRMEEMSERFKGHKRCKGAQGLLVELWRQDGLTNAEIAEVLDIRPSSVTAQVKSLENKGLVERRQDQNDKRIIRVFLTDAGRAAKDEKDGVRNNITIDLFDGLTDEEQAQLKDLLEKIITSNGEFNFEKFTGWHSSDQGDDDDELSSFMRQRQDQFNEMARHPHNRDIMGRMMFGDDWKNWMAGFNGQRHNGFGPDEDGHSGP